MAKPVYLTPDGEICLQEDFDRFQSMKDEDGNPINPYLRREYKNERLHMQLVARHHPPHNFNDIPPEHWQRAEVVIHNIVTTDAEGNPLGSSRAVIDVAGSRTFTSVEKASIYFDQFLVDWTESARASDGSVKEVGNLLAPKTADEPTVIAGREDVFGSW